MGIIPKQYRNDYRVCREVMRKASSNYWSASRVCPRDKIPHIEAIYAVLRIGDDLVDEEVATEVSARIAIEGWQKKYWKAFETGDSKYPVLRAFLNTAHTFNISPDLLDLFFRSMIADTATTRYETFDDLLGYMAGSAFPAGRLFSHVFGTKTGIISDAYPVSDSLAIAMQLTNFIRDIDEDYQKGRIYIPLKDLDRFKVRENDIGHKHMSTEFVYLLKYEINLAKKYYKQVERQLMDTWETSHWAIMSSLYIYRYILVDIIQKNYDVFSGRTGATRFQKMRLILSAWLHTTARSKDLNQK